MANLFVLNIAGTTAPVADDKNASALIARAATLLAGDSDVPSAPEPIDVDARRAALFGEVTSGALSMDDAVAALKALDVEVVAAAAIGSKRTLRNNVQIQDRRVCWLDANVQVAVCCGCRGYGNGALN